MSYRGYGLFISFLKLRPELNLLKPFRIVHILVEGRLQTFFHIVLSSFWRVYLFLLYILLLLLSVNLCWFYIFILMCWFVCRMNNAKVRYFYFYVFNYSFAHLFKMKCKRMCLAGRGSS